MICTGNCETCMMPREVIFKNNITSPVQESVDTVTEKTSLPVPEEREEFILKKNIFGELIPKKVK